MWKREAQDVSKTSVRPQTVSFMIWDFFLSLISYPEHCPIDVSHTQSHLKLPLHGKRKEVEGKAGQTDLRFSGTPSASPVHHQHLSSVHPRNSLPCNPKGPQGSFSLYKWSYVWFERHCNRDRKDLPPAGSFSGGGKSQSWDQTEARNPEFHSVLSQGLQGPMYLIHHLLLPERHKQSAGLEAKVPGIH